MRFYLIRHGTAEPGAEGLPDESRALTERGWKRTRRAMRGLARIAKLDHVLTSPLVRARETAEVVTEAFELPDAEVAPELAPGGDLDALFARLAAGDPQRQVALVGHMPGLAVLASVLAGGDESFGLEL